MCLDVDRRASGQSDTESHEKLAQRIEKDVVSVFIHLSKSTQILSPSYNAVQFILNVGIFPF